MAKGKIILDDTIFTCNRAYHLGIILLLVSIIQVPLILLFPIAESANAKEIYLRNFSTVFVYLALSVYFSRWAYINYVSEHRKNTMKGFKVLTFAVALITLAKAFFSGYMATVTASTGNLIWTYYIGDTIVWIAISVFLFVYSVNIVYVAPKKSDTGE